MRFGYLQLARFGRVHPFGAQKLQLPGRKSRDATVSLSMESNIGSIIRRTWVEISLDRSLSSSGVLEGHKEFLLIKV